MGIDEREEEHAQGCAGTGPIAQTTTGNTSATPMEADVQPPMEIEQEEQEVEVGDTTDVSVRTQEDLATAVASTPTATLDHTY